MNFTRRISSLATALGLGAVLALAGCGGGGGGDGPGAAAAQDTVVGPISGFGSIIVNGLRIEDGSARISDDDGGAIARDDLRLGMTVEIRGKINDDGTGTAGSISLFSELQGPISGLDPVAGSFTILGFAIQTDGATVFEDVSGLDALADGDIVEVFGLRSGNQLTASRIERKSPNTGSALIKLRGQLANLNPGATTFTLGAATVNYANAEVRPSLGALADGAFVKVRSTQAPSGTLVSASRVQVVGNSPFVFDHGAKSELEGVIADFASAASFTVLGVPVDASGARILRGTLAQLGNGVRVEVDGSFTNGTLVATRLKFEDRDGEDEFEVHGVVANFVSPASFEIRGVRIDASGAGVVFERGSRAQIANGRQLEVEGSMLATPEGSILLASKLKFEDVSGANRGNGRDDDDEFEFKGRVTAVGAGSIEVGGRLVVLDSATQFRRMSPSDAVLGALLEIKGELRADGSVRAQRISLED